jgi:hypothetical protein
MISHIHCHSRPIITTLVDIEHHPVDPIDCQQIISFNQTVFEFLFKWMNLSQCVSSFMPCVFLFLASDPEVALRFPLSTVTPYLLRE